MVNMKTLLLNIFLYFFPLLVSASQTTVEYRDFYKDAVKMLISEHAFESARNKLDFNSAAYLTESIKLSRDEIVNAFKDQQKKYRHYKNKYENNTQDLADILQPLNNDLAHSLSIISDMNWELKVTGGEESEINKPLGIILVNSAYAFQQKKRIEWEKQNNIQENNINKEEKDLALKKMHILVESLYLIATSLEDIQANKTFFKSIATLFHPDKTSDEQEIAFFREASPLLKDNVVNERLSVWMRDIEATRERSLENNLSLMKSIAIVATDFVVIKGSEVLGYKTAVNLFSDKKLENKCSKQCVKAFAENALQIERELIKSIK